MSEVVPVILCGGQGKRLWPESQVDRPKIFFEMDDGRSLLRHAMDRARLIASSGPVVAVTGRGFAAQTEREWLADDVGGSDLTLITEPVGRNTAPAIAVAALHAAETYGRDTILFVLPSDHLIEDEQAFARYSVEAARRARNGELVIFGINPTEPSNSYGYIQHRDGKVLRFHEKPDEMQARAYLDKGGSLWNSGMVCATAGRLLDALGVHIPALLSAARAALHAAGHPASDPSRFDLDAGYYETCPDISFDHAVLEREADLGVVQTDFDWQDVGNWKHLGEMAPVDPFGNHVRGNATLLDTSNSIIRAGDKPVGIIGLDNVVVVDSPQGLLIARADAVEQVKSLFAGAAPLGFGEDPPHKG